MSGIEVMGLVKQWGEVRAVDDVSFRVPEGGLTVLLGPSGCGKSTILRLIAGLEDATAGRVAIGEREVTGLDAAKRGVSMVFQSYALFPHLSVRENIVFGLKVRRVRAAQREERLQRAARMVGLETLLERKPAQLSGGQRQRVALARAIVAERPICLMDEPLSNLDAKLRAEMRDDIRALRERLGLTMVYVTHDQTEAMTLADEVVLLQDGRVVQIGSPRQLYETPASAFAARFFGTPPMNILALDADDDQAAALMASTGSPPPQRRGWSLGVRPEDVRVGDHGIPARVGAVEYLGAEAVVRLHLGQQSLMARIGGPSEFRPGDAVQVHWQPAAAHLFDEQGTRQDGDAAALPRHA